MFRGLKARYPHVHIKALTAVEIAHIARIEKMSIARRADRAARGGARHDAGRRRRGVQPGRPRDHRRQEAGGRGVHRRPPRRRTRSASARNCTMLYGHVETIRGPHGRTSSMLRDLQDETGGFLAYIPLAYHPDNNELGDRRSAAQGTATTGFDDLKNLAVGRLFLDNFEHIKSHWIMVTPFLSQTSLHFGVNDLEGTVVREKIYHEAGAHTAQAMTLDEISPDPRRREGARRARLVLQHPPHVFDDSARAPTAA